MRNTSFKLNSQPKKKIKVLPLVALAILIAGVVGGLLLYKHREDTRRKNADSEVKANEDENLATGNTENGDIKQGLDNPDQSTTPEESTTMTAKVSSFSQQNGTVTVSAAITGAAAAGRCTITFSSTDSRPVSREVSTAAEGVTQQCSVSIPEVEFDKLGEWNLAVLFITGTTRATVEQKVIIK